MGGILDRNLRPVGSTDPTPPGPPTPPPNAPPHSAFSAPKGDPATPARDDPPSPSMARQEGASCDVKRQAIPLTVISTMPTPVHAQKREKKKMKKLLLESAHRCLNRLKTL